LKAGRQSKDLQAGSEAKGSDSLNAIQMAQANSQYEMDSGSPKGANSPIQIKLNFNKMTACSAIQQNIFSTLVFN